MHIVSTRRPAPGSRALAVVDVDVGGARIFNIEVVRGADGGLRAWAPRRRGEHVAAFTPELAGEIVRAAIAVVGGGAAHAG